MQDAIMWSAHTDSAIVVIRQDYLARSQILNTLDTLSESGVDLTGCVINGDSGAPGSYGYGRYGYGNYGYGKYGNYGKNGDSETAKTKMH
jgi:Mrp family chromosome partitioning ATPase